MGGLLRRGFSTFFGVQIYGLTHTWFYYYCTFPSTLGSDPGVYCAGQAGFDKGITNRSWYHHQSCQSFLFSVSIHEARGGNSFNDSIGNEGR